MLSFPTPARFAVPPGEQSVAQGDEHPNRDEDPTCDQSQQDADSEWEAVFAVSRLPSAWATFEHVSLHGRGPFKKEGGRDGIGLAIWYRVTVTIPRHSHSRVS